VCAGWKRVFRPRPLSSSRNCIRPPRSCLLPFSPCFPHERLAAVKPFFHYEIVTRERPGVTWRDRRSPAFLYARSLHSFSLSIHEDSVNRETRTPSPAYHEFAIRFAMSLDSPFNRHECSGEKEPDVEGE